MRKQMPALFTIYREKKKQECPGLEPSNCFTNLVKEVLGLQTKTYPTPTTKLDITDSVSKPMGFVAPHKNRPCAVSCLVEGGVNTRESQYPKPRFLNRYHSANGNFIVCEKCLFFMCRVRSVIMARQTSLSFVALVFLLFLLTLVPPSI